MDHKRKFENTKKLSYNWSWVIVCSLKTKLVAFNKNRYLVSSNCYYENKKNISAIDFL